MSFLNGTPASGSRGTGGGPTSVTGGGITVIVLLPLAPLASVASLALSLGYSGE